MKKRDSVLRFWCWAVLHLRLRSLKNGRYVWTPELLSLNSGVRNSENIPNRNLANKLNLLLWCLLINLTFYLLWKKHFLCPISQFLFFCCRYNLYAFGPHKRALCSEGLSEERLSGFHVFLLLHLCLLLQEDDRQSPAAHHPPALCLWLVWTFSSSSIIYRTSLTDSTALSFFLFSAWAPLVVSPPQDRWSWRCHRASIRRRRTTASLWSGTSPPERTARPVCFLSSVTW